MRNRTNTAAYRDESRLFYAMLSLLVVVSCLYMYFVSTSVMHVVLRKEVDHQIIEVATSVSNLEELYIEMQHNVSSEIASHQGFIVADKKIFIDRTRDTLVLSTN